MLEHIFIIIFCCYKIIKTKGIIKFKNDYENRKKFDLYKNKNC